jgi:predicted oxidoreductase
MKTQLLGTSDLRVTRLSYGCMRIVRTWNPAEVDAQRTRDAFAMLDAAMEAGYTLIDHADIYCHGKCEEVFGQWLKQNAAMRAKLVIATKCGIRFPGDPNPDSPHRYDFDKAHILWSAEQSLKRLQIDTIDLYQLHRPDVLMNPPEIAEAFVQLREQGKVRHFGVSNFTPAQVNALRAHLPFDLIVNQVQISLGFLQCVEDGTLDQCVEKRITPLAWSPVAGGHLGTGKTISDNHPRREQLLPIVAVIDEVATKLGTTRTVVALAWLLKHPSGVIPIVGSTRPDGIKEAILADDLELSREDWYRLYVAGRGKKLP